MTVCGMSAVSGFPVFIWRRAGVRPTAARFPAIHGGQFDVVVEYAKWFTHLRRKPGFTYRSLSAYLKHRVRNAVEMEGVLYCNDGDWVERTSGELWISRLGGFTSLAASQGGSVKILIVSDAWYPQVNGVVRTLATVRDELVKLGHSVEIIGPDRFRTVPMPTYPEIRLALGAGPEDGGTDRGDRSRRHPHRDRRPAGLRRPRMVPEARHTLHDRLPHPLSRNMSATARRSRWR